ncbi:MAG: hypothetical protein ABI330_10810 [Caldimonas sp.]
MARIPYFDLTQAPSYYTDLVGARKPLNLYRMLRTPAKRPKAS